jgi:hypothetical protein
LQHATTAPDGTPQSGALFPAIAAPNVEVPNEEDASQSRPGRLHFHQRKKQVKQIPYI